MSEYITASLETHLFSGRIMKEHAVFLLTAFPAGEMAYRNQANCFREQFEKVLERAVCLADGVVSEEVLDSGEVFTEFTEIAEQQTRKLTKIPIDIRITQAEKRLRAGNNRFVNQKMISCVQKLNQDVLYLVKKFISFKEKILGDVLSCCLYTSNYPLLIEHIIREAKLYCRTLISLEERGELPVEDMGTKETFWNRIMMEHALFIRGSLDPTECGLIEKADGFAGLYCQLLKAEKTMDCREMDEVFSRTLEVTEQYQDFKEAGTKGITECQIRSVILPLLADHVLREANHYLRILKM